MPRFFIAASNLLGGVACIDGSDIEHLKVLRIKKGEVFTVCDGKGKDYVCRLKSADSKTAEAEIIEVKESVGEPSVFCTVYAAFPKAEKAESIVQKAVELGASKIVFFPSARCVSRPDEAAALKKCIRWQKISEEAAKQSSRGIIPEVLVNMSFEKTIALAAESEMPLFFYEAETDLTLKEALCQKQSYKTVSIVTGAEGGFEKEEVIAAKKSGMYITSMGDRILRCETAPVCALAAIMYHTDNL